MTFAKTVAAAVVTLAIAGCAQQEEEVVFIEEEPIFAKDGTVIGSRPMVGGDGMSSDMSDGDDMSMSSDGDDDDDDDSDG